MTFITKQRRVGGSMVFTVPKRYAQMMDAMVCEGSGDGTVLYQVTQREDGAIVYTPLMIQPVTLNYVKKKR
jgi:hypothetical protein